MALVCLLVLQRGQSTERGPVPWLGPRGCPCHRGGGGEGCRGCTPGLCMPRGTPAEPGWARWGEAESAMGKGSEGQGAAAGAAVGPGYPDLSGRRASHGTRGTGGDERCRGTLLCTRPCPPTPVVLSAPGAPSHTIAVGWSPAGQGQAAPQSQTQTRGVGERQDLRGSSPQWNQAGTWKRPSGGQPRPPLRMHHANELSWSLLQTPGCCCRWGAEAHGAAGGWGGHGCAGLRSHPITTRTWLQTRASPTFP